MRGVCHVGREQVPRGIEVAEHHAPWPQGWGFAVAPAPTNCDATPTASGPQRHLFGQPSLTDTGRPADHHHLPIALASSSQELQKLAEFTRPPDERRFNEGVS